MKSYNDKTVLDSKTNDEGEELLRKLVAEYEPRFAGLTREQKKLLAYRKIIELRQKNGFLREIFKKATAKNMSEEEIMKYKDLWREQIYHIWAIIEACDDYRSINVVTAFTIHENGDKEYRDLYQESLINYNKILENYHKLAQELKLSSALEISHLFTYMLWNGYYSFNKEHSYKLQSRLLLPSMNSFDVIKGQGVCLGYAELLHNYLTTCNHQSAILCCKVPTNKRAITIGYRPEIVRHQQSSTLSKISSKTLNILLSGLIKHTGNHAVTLIEDNDKQFIYDPTNLYVLKILNSKQAAIINGQGIYEMKPHSSFFSESNCDPFRLFEKILFCEQHQAFSEQELIYSFESTLDLIKNNINLLDDAYDSIQPYLAFINQQTNEIGGFSKVMKKMKQLEK